MLLINAVFFLFLFFRFTSKGMQASRAMKRLIRWPMLVPLSSYPNGIQSIQEFMIFQPAQRAHVFYDISASPKDTRLKGLGL